MNKAIVLTMLAAVAARAEETPMLGDPAHGARIYRVHCAGCHGVDRAGKGPLAPELSRAGHPAIDLTHPANLIPYDNATLSGIIGKGVKPAMPGFEQALSVLDTFDLIAFLRQDMVTVADFFPIAARYTAKVYELDAYAIDKVEKAMNEKVKPEDKSMLVIVGFLGEVAADGPELVPQVPRLLDSLPWRRKTGYLTFVPVPFAGKTFAAGMAIDPEGVITELRTVAGPKAERARLDPILAAFVELGGRNVAKKPLEPPKAKKVPADIVKAVSRGFWRTNGAIGLHDKEERDRHVFDADYGDASIEAGGELKTKEVKAKK